MTGFTAMATVINSVLATNFHFRGILGFLLQPTSIGFPETQQNSLMSSLVLKSLQPNEVLSVS